MRVGILFFLLLFLSSCSSNTSSNKQQEEENYELVKQNLLKKEQQNPPKFLFVNGNNKFNLIGQLVIKGSIQSKATVATYKDVVLKMTFFSKTKALLETNKETIFEIWPPGITKKFKTKYFAPKGTDSVAFEIVKAEVVL